MLRKTFVRSAASIVGLATLMATTAIATSRPSLAADEVSPLTTRDEITIRGEIKDVRTASRMFGVDGNDRDYLVF